MPVTLKRRLSPLPIIFYGLDAILGAGISVLVGEVTATAGLYTLLASLLCMAVALVALLSLPLENLAGMHAPLAQPCQNKTGNAPTLITLIKFYDYADPGTMDRFFLSAVP